MHGQRDTTSPAAPFLQRLIKQALHGGLIGTLATLPMSLVIVAGQALGLLVTPPPEQISATVAAKADVLDDLPEPAFTTSWLIAHFGYGAACGALYRPISALLPIPPVIAGPAFGLLVWAVSYLKLMPALHLFPHATRDRPSRQAVMIVAHVVFGGALAALDRQPAPGRNE